MGKLTAAELTVLAIIRDNIVSTKSAELPLTRALIGAGLVAREDRRLFLTPAGEKQVQGVRSPLCVSSGSETGMSKGANVPYPKRA